MDRIHEMKRLRFEELLTNTEIGRRQNPPISRERVRQLIGNTGRGFSTRRKKRIWEQNKHLSNSKLSEELGVGAGQVILYREGEWHGAEESRAWSQETVSKILSEHGFKNKLLQNKWHRRIFLENGKEIHVISSNPLDLYGTGAKSYTFTTRDQKCDFYACLCIDTMDVFIIPYKATRKRTPIRFTFPCTHHNKSKWLSYCNRFDLLEKE